MKKVRKLLQMPFCPDVILGIAYGCAIKTAYNCCFYTGMSILHDQTFLRG